MRTTQLRTLCVQFLPSEILRINTCHGCHRFSFFIGEDVGSIPDSRAQDTNLTRAPLSPAKTRVRFRRKLSRFAQVAYPKNQLLHSKQGSGRSVNNIIIISAAAAAADILFHWLFADVASEHAEGGMYIAPEFLLGQVYDGANPETVVLYKPVYVAVRKNQEDDLKNNMTSSTINRVSSTSTPRLNCI